MSESRPPTPEEQILFLRRFQRLLDEGSFVATYKFALLYSIADLCVAKGDDTGARLELSTEDIADRFIELYWAQAAPFLHSESVDVLAQNTGRRQAAVVREISERYRDVDGSLGRLQRDPEGWRQLRGLVQSTVQKMPLWRLQTVGEERVEFLYPNLDRGAEISLEPGVAYCFRAFYPMLIEMVEGAWLQYVRRYNPNVLGPESDLRAFLFGAPRASLDRFRSVLREHQGDRCFYCDRGIRGASHVDHFIPWRRYSLDLGHNFVLAHPTCNERKGDRLAAEEHLAKWVERNDGEGSGLVDAFETNGLAHDVSVTRRVARWAYGQVEVTQAKVWLRGRELVVLGDWRSVLLDLE